MIDFRFSNTSWSNLRSSPLSLLTTLVLVHPVPHFSKSFDEDWTSFLNPTLLPALRELTFASQNQYSFKPYNAWANAIGGLAPQLKTFSLAGPEELPALDWGQFMCLGHLSLSTSFSYIANAVMDFCDFPSELLSILQLSTCNKASLEYDQRGKTRVLLVVEQITRLVLDGVRAYSGLKKVTLAGDDDGGLTRTDLWHRCQESLDEVGVKLSREGFEDYAYCTLLRSTLLFSRMLTRLLNLPSSDEMDLEVEVCYPS